MSRLFQKAIGAQRLFKKASGVANGFFKKNGTLDRKIAGGLGSVAKGIREGVNKGSRALSVVEGLPLGGALTPITSVARTGLGMASLVGNAAGAAKGVIRSAYKGNVLEATKRASAMMGPTFM